MERSPGTSTREPVQRTTPLSTTAFAERPRTASRLVCARFAELQYQAGTLRMGTISRHPRDLKIFSLRSRDAVLSTTKIIRIAGTDEHE